MIAELVLIARLASDSQRTKRDPPHHQSSVHRLLNPVLGPRPSDARDDCNKTHWNRSKEKRVGFMTEHDEEEPGISDVAGDCDDGEREEQRHVEDEEGCADAAKDWMCSRPRQVEKEGIDDAGSLLLCRQSVPLLTVGEARERREGGIAKAPTLRSGSPWIDRQVRRAIL